MKSRLLHPAIAAAGLSLVCCLSSVEPLISPHHHWIYHVRQSVASIFFPVLFYMVGLWLLLFLLLSATTRSNRMKVLVWSGLILFTPWLLLPDMVMLSARNLPRWLGTAVFVASGLTWLGVVLLWRKSFVPVFARVQRFSSRMLGLAGFCSFLVLGQMAWCFWSARALRLPHTLHAVADQTAALAPTARPRVIWIILDELSYQQVYERRFPSLELPAFDRLASQSTVFTRVTPAAMYTEAAVPSLMTGLRADRVIAGADGTLSRMHDPVTGRWQPFLAQDTVFHDALNYGFRTAVAGWYNPYCRILADVLDRCRWIFRQESSGGMFAEASIRANLLAPWRNLSARVALPGTEKVETNDTAEAHIADYREIVSAGDEFLDDSSINFLFLHIPVPHPGGIYDRRTRTFTTHHSSYIDNLALADTYLAHVRQILEQRGEWDSSAIVVMGDHSWRTKLIWMGAPGWTAEDEAASHGGQFDARPAYIVKLPHQTEAARIETPFSAVRTRALLQGILNGSIRSVAELADFAGQPPNKNERPELLTTRVEEAGTGNRDR